MPVAARMPAGIIAALLLALNCNAARAETTADTLAQWGMLGTWAISCTAPASPSNYYLSYRGDPQGRAFHDRSSGTASDVNPILSARLLDNGMIELIIDYRGQGARRLALMKGPDGRIRAMWNSRADGTDPAVRDGRLLHNGADTPWQTRCGELAASLAN